MDTYLFNFIKAATALALCSLFISCTKSSTQITPLNSGSKVINTVSFNNPQLTSPPGTIGFSIDFDNDDNLNSTVEVLYCNESDSPGCVPTLSLGNMTRGATSFSFNIPTLSAPDDEGDNLSFRLVGLDPDGVSTPTNFDISASVPVNSINISNFQVSNYVTGGFDVTFDFTGDENSSAVPALVFCNQTDSPGCTPSLTPAITVNRLGSSYSLTISGLTSPNDPADILNIRVTVTDVDGASGGPLNGTATLPVASIEVSNMFVGNIGEQNFSVSVDYLHDDNNNATLSLSYCNLTDAPACSPSLSLGDLIRGDSNYYKSIVSSDLAAGDSPGDTLQIQVITADVDGVSGSPQNFTFKLADSGGVTHIYRSVGPGNTSPLEVGTTNSMAISDSTATFSNPIALNIGVGDVIQYDSNGDSGIDSLAFIYARLSSTTYTVKNSAGADPTPVTADLDWSIFRAHISIDNAENGVENTGIEPALVNFDTWTNSNDIVLPNQIWHIAVYADAADTVPASFVSWTTSEQNYLRVFAPSSQFEVGVSQRHAGVWDDTKARSEVTNDRNLYIISDNVIVEGLQFRNNISGSFSNRSSVQVSSAGTSRITIKNNIIRGDLSGSGSNVSGIRISNSFATSQVNVFNNIIYDFNKSSSYGIYGFTTTPINIYNNTIYGCDKGVLGGSNTLLKNNIVQNSTLAGYQGTMNASSDYNISDFTDAPGSNSVNSSMLTFVSIAGRNFNLAPGDTDALNNGVNLTTDLVLPFSSDIKGAERTGVWDLGAFNY